MYLCLYNLLRERSRQHTTEQNETHVAHCSLQSRASSSLCTDTPHDRHTWNEMCSFTNAVFDYLIYSWFMLCTITECCRCNKSDFCLFTIICDMLYMVFPVVFLLICVYQVRHLYALQHVLQHHEITVGGVCMQDGDFTVPTLSDLEAAYSMLFFLTVRTFCSIASKYVG